MKTYFIADTHFNHKNIVEYCNRPFPDVDAMNFNLIKSWNSVVKKSDIVYHLGDFALGGIENLAGLRAQLNGRIFLIMGNHDTLKMKRYYEAGFDKVYDKPILLEKYFILSHAPLFLPDNMPYANIFGHVHNDLKYASITKNSFCVSVERINYKPISFTNIQKQLKQENM